MCGADLTGPDPDLTGLDPDLTGLDPVGRGQIMTRPVHQP